MAQSCREQPCLGGCQSVETADTPFVQKITQAAKIPLIGCDRMFGESPLVTQVLNKSLDGLVVACHDARSGHPKTNARRAKETGKPLEQNRIHIQTVMSWIA